MYPEDSVQFMLDEWWVEDSAFGYCRGRLIKAFLPHIDQIPKQLTATGRYEATDHRHAYFSIQPLRIGQPQRKTSIPVAALPLFGNEIHAIYRAKKRPAIVICEGGSDVERRLTLGKPKWQTSPTILVAPCYGAEEGEKRAGFNPEFLARVRRCVYPQFLWDRLPIGGAAESIFRLDHIQPVGKHHDAIELTQYRLSEDAVMIFDEWLRWLFFSELPEDSLLRFFKESIEKI